MKTMLKVVSLVAALVLLIGAIPVSAATLDKSATYYLKDQAANIKLIGRAEVTDAGVVPHTTASGFAFYSECSGDIEVTISGSSNIFNAQYFIVYVDGEIHNRIAFEHGKAKPTKAETFTAASNLKAGMHRIEIYRETEEINASCVINSITLNGTLTPVPERPMLIEFVGDSITTGFGAYPVTDESERLLKDYPYGDHPIRQAGTKSYAFLTAQELGLDFQACCTSGYGVEVGFNTDPEVDLQLMYPYTAYHHDSSADAMWSFDRPADIVVINLGTNDSGAAPGKGVKKSEIVEGIEDMMKLAREKNPNAKIVWVTGMMGTVYKVEVKKIVKELGGADAGYYFCELPRGMSGGGGHPDESEHIAASEKLVKFLKSDVLPSDFGKDYKTAADLKALCNQSTLTDADRAIIDLEIAIGDGAMMTGLYEMMSQKAAKTAPTTTAVQSQDGGNGNMMIIVIVVAVVAALAVAAVVVFAIVYKPKKKDN